MCCEREIPVPLASRSTKDHSLGMTTFMPPKGGMVSQGREVTKGWFLASAVGRAYTGRASITAEPSQLVPQPAPPKASNPPAMIRPCPSSITPFLNITCWALVKSVWSVSLRMSTSTFST